MDAFLRFPMDTLRLHSPMEGDCSRKAAQDAQSRGKRGQPLCDRALTNHYMPAFVGHNKVDVSVNCVNQGNP